MWQPPSGGGGRRGIKALIVGLVMVVLLGGGAFAFYQADPFNLFRAGPQAAEALPANSMFYFGVDLDPSAEQKVNALRFLDHFPSFGDTTGVTNARDDVRETIIQEILETSDCPDITFENDIEPWIGNKLGMAAVPAENQGDEPDFAIALETSDYDAAKEGLNKVSSCAGGLFGTAQQGDYVIIAETPELAEKFADSAGEESLADNDDFTADMAAIGDLGIATAWVDIQGLVEESGGLIGMGETEQLAVSLYQRASATFRFEADSAEIVSAVYGDWPDVDPGENQIVDLPESTAFAMSMSGGEQTLLDSWDTILESVRDQGVDVDAEIADFEEQTGLSIPDDLATLLGDNLMLAVDSGGLTAEALEAEDPSLVNAGVRFTNDPDELNSIYDTVLDLLQQEMDDVPFSKQDADDGIVIATNDDYANQLAELDGNLGDSDAFTSVVDDAGDKQFVAFFNFDSVEDEVIAAIEDDGASIGGDDVSGNAELIENLRPLQAVGLAQGLEGDYYTSSLQISVND
jgi:hypothetical protein